MGIGIGITAAAILFGIGLWLYLRRRKANRDTEQAHVSVFPTEGSLPEKGADAVTTVHVVNPGKWAEIDSEPNASSRSELGADSLYSSKQSPVELFGSVAVEIDSNPPRKSRDGFPILTNTDSPILPPMPTPKAVLPPHRRGSGSTGSQTPLISGIALVSPMESMWESDGERHRPDSEQNRTLGLSPRDERQRMPRPELPKAKDNNFI